MSLNECRNEAGEFMAAVGTGPEHLPRILKWLDEESAELKAAADRNDLPRLRHQIYDVMFLLFELAAQHGLDLDTEWAAGRRRKQAKYLSGKAETATPDAGR